MLRRQPDPAAVNALRRLAGRPLAPAQGTSQGPKATKVPRSALLPALAPADPPAQRTAPVVGLTVPSKAVRDEETRFSLREETRSPVACLTVYVLNAILLVIAFPIGFGMLVFNILGGENLRTTAHVIALTGFAIALTGGAVGSDFLYGS